MDVVELNLSVEARLYPKQPETRQHFFYFFTIFLLLVPLRSPASSSGSAENESFDWLSAKTTIDCEAPNQGVKMKFE